MPRFRQRTLPPCIGRMLPRLAIEPAIVPGTLLGPVLTVLVDNRSPADDRLETIRLSFDEGGHFATVAIAHQSQLARIDGISRDHRIHASHNVAIVGTPQVVLVSRGKARAISCAAPRI